MNPNAQFERDLEQWLQSEAGASAPAGFHAMVMAKARTLRQRPGWATSLPVRRLGRGRGMTLLAAAALLLVGGALAAGSGILRLPSVVPPVPQPSVIAVATASPDATSPSPSESTAPSASPIPVAGPGGAWIPVGSMGTPRVYHAAVRLLDGRVLVLGGSGGESDPTTAELYDPVSGTWSATGSMLHPADFLPPVVLLDGRVLVGDIHGDNPKIPGAELYDPATGTWSATGDLIETAGAPVMVLPDGRVLANEALYDPTSGTWSATGKRTIDAFGAIGAALLPDGRVLVAGGYIDIDYNPTDAAQAYSPATGSWTPIAPMQAPHSIWKATVLPDGTVLVVPRHGSSERYDPVADTWTVLGQPVGFNSPQALLSDGTVLMTDPDETDPGPGPRAECTAAALYDPYTGSTTTATSMLRCADGSSFTLLLDGTVLKAGGRDCNDEGRCISNGVAELYVPAGVPMPPFSFAPPPPLVFPSPTPRPTLFPPATGPVPPNARSWTITVDNRSSAPATLFVAEEGEGGTLRLVGSATPNVVPAGAVVKVTFLFPTKGGPDGWIYVNPRPGEGGSLVHAADIGIPGKILITADGQSGWLSP